MIYLDLETWPIGPGARAPRPVCAQVGGAGPYLRDDPWSVRDPIEDAWVISARSDRFWPLVRDVIAAPAVATVSMFDWLVLMEHGPTELVDAILTAGEGGRLIDLQTVERLIHIAIGIPLRGQRFGLDALGRANRAPTPAKDSPWRLRYGELADVPPRRWPIKALAYALGDVTCLPAIDAAQRHRAARVGADLRVAGRQSTHALWRDLISAHGLRTDPAVVTAYDRATREKAARAAVVLREAGLLTRQPDGSSKRADKRMRAWVARVAPPGHPRTKTGPSLAAEDLRRLGEPVATAWADYASADATASRVEEWRAATREPVHARFELTENSRSLTHSPNTQNRPIRGLDRECVAPSAGRVYLITDHDGMELDTVSQVLMTLVGWSRMAEARRAGEDLHARVGARVLGCAPNELLARRRRGDEEAGKARQVGKRANFAFAGGAGGARVAREAWRLEGLRLAEDDRENVAAWCRVKKLWIAEWPEFVPYFRICNAIATGSGQLRALVDGKVRGSCGYADAANGFFSELGAYMTHAVIGRLQRATRVGDGPLRGCRLEHFVHDEYLVSVPEDEHLDARAAELERIVVGTAREYLPAVDPRAEVIATRRWGKRARRVEDAAGRLGVWEWDALTEATWRVGEGADPAKTPRGDDAILVLSALGSREVGPRRDLDHHLHALARGWGRGPELPRSIEVARSFARVL